MWNGSRVERWPVVSAPFQIASHHTHPTFLGGAHYQHSCLPHHKIDSPVPDPTRRPEGSACRRGWGETPTPNLSAADHSPSFPCTPSHNEETCVATLHM